MDSKDVIYSFCTGFPFDLAVPHLSELVSTNPIS